jgi:membrane protease subunit HflK
MRLVTWLILIAGLIWTAATAVTQVQPGERAVVRRFGRVLQNKPEPGLFIGLPWGLDQVERVPVGRVRRVLVGMVDQAAVDDDIMPPGQLLTGDHNLVNLQAEIHYTVRTEEVEKFAFQAERAEALVARAAEAALAEWIAGRKVDDVLLSGSSRLPGILVERVQAYVDRYDVGVRIEQASARLSPPAEVKEAFEKVAQAETGIGTQINQAKQLAARRQRDAEADKFKLERDTAAYVQEQRLKAQADAASFRVRLAQYRKLRDRDPDYLNTLWLDEMTRIYAQMRTAGRIDLLDHFLTSEGLSITQFPLSPRKK